MARIKLVILSQKVKTLLNKVFGLAGVQMNRLPQPIDDKSGNDYAVGVLNFGPYKIESHSKAQLDAYSQIPTCNRFLGRLAACMSDSAPKAGIIDVGANCGDTAALMRSHTGLPILCVEGDLNLFALLKDNARQCPDITLINSYVGEVTGPVSVRIEKEGWNNTLVPSENSDSIIQIVRLDELKDPWLANRKVALLKVDAEGFDVPILFGAKKILEASKPVIAFEYNRDNMDTIGEPGLRVFPFLASLGYEGLMIYDNYGRYFMTTTIQSTELLTELHRFIKHADRGIFYFDMLAFPKDEAKLLQKFKNSEIERMG